MTKAPFALAGFLLLVGASAVRITHAKPATAHAAASPAIARVDGKPVLHRDIQPTPEEVKRAFRMAYGRDPDGKADAPAWERLRRATEVRKLRERFRRALQASLIRQYGLTATDAEVEQDWKGRIAAMTPEERRQIQDGQRQLLDALDRIYDQGADPYLVYHTMLRSSPFGVRDWNAHLAFYKSKERRRQMRTQLDSIPLEACRLQDQGPIVRAAARNALLCAKLEKIVETGVARIRKAGVKPAGTDPYDLWWDAQVKKTGAAVLDPKYRDAYPRIMDPCQVF